MRNFVEFMQSKNPVIAEELLSEKSFKMNPDHKGWCTPLSNPHCTGKRKAFAKEAKAGVFNHKDK